jgi:arylformamidase
MFVPGGGWTSGSKDSASGPYKSGYYPSEGYAYASINYRLVPSVTVEDEAADVVAALKSLLDHADELGIDPSRVVIMGHSAGAYLVALVGTDESYLAAAGLSPTAHGAAPNAPAFLLPHVQRPDGIAQADELAAALQAAGTSAEEASFPGTGLAGHAEINRRLGDLSYAETPVVDAWLAKVFA